MIKEYEVSRISHTTILRPSNSSLLTDIVSSRDSEVGILSVDGQIAKIEFEQSSASDLMERRTAPICRRHNETESKEKPLISFDGSASGDEDATQTWRTLEEVAPTSIRYDVAVSILMTPETWAKKMQFDSSNPQ
nr:hypothetical protein HmN_000352000 [Hymenolepis microstoma]